MSTILEKALEVFSSVGYRESNLTLIADACGLSRPTVYQYFSDKKEIYYYAVKRVTHDLFDRFSAIAFREEGGDEIDRLKEIVRDLFAFTKENEGAVANLVEFILAEKKEGTDVNAIIMSRTVKMRILLKRLLLQGVHRGTIRECDIDVVGDEIYSLMQAEAFQVGFFRSFSPDDAAATVSAFLESFRKNIPES